MNMIEVSNLTKQFGDITAIDSLSFSVAQGEVFGLLGPNGAGKTTTIRMLCCLISKTSGEAHIAAQQLGTLIILPFAALYLLSELRVLALNTANLLIVAGVLVLLDGIVFYLVQTAFQREEILTRWK